MGGLGLSSVVQQRFGVLGVSGSSALSPAPGFRRLGLNQDLIWTSRAPMTFMRVVMWVVVKIRCRIILGIQKGTIILTTTHVDQRPHAQGVAGAPAKPPGMHRASDSGFGVQMITMIVVKINYPGPRRR